MIIFEYDENLHQLLHYNTLMLLDHGRTGLILFGGAQHWFARPLYVMSHSKRSTLFEIVF